MTKMAKQFKKAFFTLLELLLRATVIPSARASILRLLGAKIGRNVRIYESTFINLDNGFKNLTVEDNVHIGHGCLFDLKARLTLGKGTTVSPRVTILTHVDPGEYHKSPVCNFYPPYEAEVIIEEHCWIGTNAVILAGSTIRRHTVVGAATLVRDELASNSLYAGIPARKIKNLSA